MLEELFIRADEPPNDALAVEAVGLQVLDLRRFVVGQTCGKTDGFWVYLFFGMIYQDHDYTYNNS